MSIGSDLTKSVTGNIESAMLVIHDYRQTNQLPGASNLTDATKLSALHDLRVAATEQALTTGQAPSYPGSRDKKLRVQFNPSQLTVNASAVPKAKQDATNGQSRSMAVEDAKLTLTVVLQFDDMDTYDAFMWDKFTSGLTPNGVSDAVKIGKELADKNKTHSIQWQIEALIAALRNPYTRLISFRWSDFWFIGQLNAVNARYTMFSTSGRPIRGEVHMRIQHEMDSAMLNHWYKSFQTAFGGDSSNLVKNEQNYSALLNLNL